MSERNWRRSIIRSSIPTAALITALAMSGLSADQPEDNQARVSISSRPSKAALRASRRADIRADVNLVLVPVGVSDPLDRPVTGLTPESFRLFEDNIEQRIVSFSKEDGPVSVGFIFDASSSMKKRMDTSIAAIREFLKNTIPGDEFFLVRFADRPELVTGFTPDPEVILQELSFVQPEGWTALLDSMCLGVQQMKKSAKNPRRALIVLTDGDDNNSRYTEPEVKNLVLESDVRIYAIGLFEKPRFLAKMASLTGGQAFWAHNLNDLPDIVERLGREFRNQYVIGYSPSNQQNDGKFRKVRIELIQSLQRALSVSWRHGYIAPQQ